jgi:RNA polymerase sigma-70 factor (ECF subfamily)
MAMDSKLKGLAMNLTKNKADAEDLVQDTYLKVFEHADTFKSEATNVNAWTFQIMKNTFLDTKKKNQATAVSYIEDFSAFSNQHAAMELAALNTAIDLLPAKQKTVLTLVAAGNTLAEVAAATNSTISLVQKRLGLARKKLAMHGTVEFNDFDQYAMPMESAKRPDLSFYNENELGTKNSSEYES